MQKALIINVFPFSIRRAHAERLATECYRLVESLGDTVIADMVYHYGGLHQSMFIGPVKAENLGKRIRGEHIGTVVINEIVKPKQIFNLIMAWSKDGPVIRVWDRIDLILQIFEKHAHTAEAKLQIRLAQVRHMGPAMYGMGHVLSQQGGGIGGRGIGETNLELMRRHWRTELQHVKKELAKIQTAKMNQLVSRRKRGYKTVSLVGYTNAGKTSLFNAMTGKDKFVKDYLFATLDSAVGVMKTTDSAENIMVSDTIGFIENLPPDVIDAFTSTLTETVHSDLILHVIDVSDPFVNEKIDSVENILTGIGIDHKKRIFVFNKTDKAKKGYKKRMSDVYRQFKPVFISVKGKTGIDVLQRYISRQLHDHKRVSGFYNRHLG